jgi:hypothetical protein
MTGRRTLLFRGAALLALLASACTLVNEFSDVKPLTDGTYQAGSPGAAPAVSVPPGPPAPSDAGDGGVPSDAGDDGGPGDAAVDAPTKPAPLGAIVVGGAMPGDGGERSVLAVLDPATGLEIAAREPMVVAAVRYDGLRDLWYLFESKSKDFIPGPSDEVVLHVRSFDLATGIWTEQGTLSIPPLESYDAISVVRERIVYVGYSPTPAAFQVTTIDTSDMTKPAVLDTQTVTGTARGLVGTRNTTGPGGVVHVVRVGSGGAGCAETAPCVEVIRIRVPNAGPPSIDAPKVVFQLASGNGVPSYGSFSSLDREVLIFPRSANSPTATSSAVLFEPRNEVIDGLAVPFIVTDSLLRRAAVSDCDHQVFVVGANGDLDLHAVPVLGDGGGAPTKASTGHSGQAVYFEPTTKTVLAPFSQGPGFDLSAFSVSGPADAPTLTRRTTADWNPPADLRPLFLGIREVIPVVCH